MRVFLERVVSSTSYIMWTYHVLKLRVGLNIWQNIHQMSEWSWRASLTAVNVQCSFKEEPKALHKCQVISRRKCCDDTHNVLGGSDNFVRFEKMTLRLSLRESLFLKKQTAGVRRCRYLPRMWKRRGIWQKHLTSLNSATAALANQTPEYTHSW